jgi:hypothetical protein
MEAASVDWSVPGPQLAEGIVVPEAVDEPGQEILLIDSIDNGEPACLIVLDGVDTGITVVRELVDDRDEEYTYYLHFGGKAFAEVDILHPQDGVVYCSGEGLSDDWPSDKRKAAEQFMLLTMLILPSVIKRDFPETQIVEDSNGDQYGV